MSLPIETAPPNTQQCSDQPSLGDLQTRSESHCQSECQSECDYTEKRDVSNASPPDDPESGQQGRKRKPLVILSRIYSSAIDGLLGVLGCHHIGCCNPGNSIHSPLFEMTIRLTYRLPLNRLSPMTCQGRL